MSGKLTPEGVIVRKDDMVATEMDGETVMMSVQQGKYYALDPVASRIWELIEKPTRIGAILDALTAEYDVDRAVCERDVMPFIETLLVEGIISAENG